MKTKIYSMFLAVCLLLGISGCGLNNPSTSNTNSENVTTVKMIKADIMQDSVQERQLRSVKRLNSSTVNSEETTTEENEDLENENSGETQEPETSVGSTEPTPSEPIVDGPQYVIIYKSETDITLTITLDNPEAHGIDALRVTCDDPEAKIQVEGEWKPIAHEADGTRVVNWSSEDPYEKTYNIRTTSLEDLYTFKVVDIRLAGHDKFLSKQTKSTDFGNNRLDIYKMDTDAYELDVVYNTFEEIKFGIKIKDGVENLSNFKVDGKVPNEEGYWVMNKSKKVEISYDFELENGSKIRRSGETPVKLLNINFGKIQLFPGVPERCYHDFIVGPFETQMNTSMFDSDECKEILSKPGYFEIRMFIEGVSKNNKIEFWVGETLLEDIHICLSNIDNLEFMYYTYFPKLDTNSYDSKLYLIENFRFKIDGCMYKVLYDIDAYGYICAIDFMEVSNV